MKIALVANTSWYLYNFRRNLMSALKAAGYQVIAIGSPDGFEDLLDREGFSQRTVNFNQVGVNPLKEARTALALRSLLHEEGIDLVLSWTPKGNIYAALALLGQHKPLIANVSGLGRAFIHKSWVTLVVKRLLKLALSRASIVFFQNSDDCRQFAAHGLVDESRAKLLPGSGVDTLHFQPRDPRAPDGNLRVLMISRLLWSKGIQEYVDAARVLIKDDPSWQFQVLGALDKSENSGVTQEQLQRWLSEGAVDYLGTSNDVREAIAAADCVVLPSYREGLPRSLLEASAMARPVLTTDVPGCRDCVDEGVNGFLFDVQSSDDLVRALREFKQLTISQRLQMGQAGRQKMETHFDERIVIHSYLTVIQALQVQK